LDKGIENIFNNKALCEDVINQIAELARKKNKVAYIAFTGGDPLVHSNIKELIKYSMDKGIHVVIKGTPWLLTDEMVKDLKELGVERFSLSLDGLEKTHDSIRRVGSFRKTIESISILKKHQIEVSIKFTVSTLNYREMNDLMKYVSESGVDIFDYQRYAPGNNNDAKYMVNKYEYRQLLIELLHSYKELKECGNNLVMTFRDHLWILLAKELGVIDESFLRNLSPYKRPICGCTMANSNVIIINANGDILPCAKVPDYVIGNVSLNRISQILLSDSFSKLGDIQNYNKCSKCSLGVLCRGCPAIGYYENKNIFNIDPQCWIDLDNSEQSCM
jgi:radical SAM protein with 4Fe4S-binding SPASM domain